MSDLGNKKILAKNLNHYMEINNKNRQQISKDLRVPYTTVTSWCKGEFYPRINRIQQLADYFSINKSDLVEEHTFNNEIKQIPLLGKIVAGYPTQMFADVIDYIDIPADMARGNKSYLLLKQQERVWSLISLKVIFLSLKKLITAKMGSFVLLQLMEMTLLSKK